MMKVRLKSWTNCETLKLFYLDSPGDRCNNEEEALDDKVALVRKVRISILKHNCEKLKLYLGRVDSGIQVSPEDDLKNEKATSEDRIKVSEVFIIKTATW